MKFANLALRFLLELGALGILGWFGAQRGTTPALKVVLGVVVFFVAAAALGSLTSAGVGWGFAGLTALNTAIVYATGPQPGETSRERRP